VRWNQIITGRLCYPVNLLSNLKYIEGRTQQVMVQLVAYNINNSLLRLRICWNVDAQLFNVIVRPIKQRILIPILVRGHGTSKGSSPTMEPLSPLTVSEPGKEAIGTWWLNPLICYRKWGMKYNTLYILCTKWFLHPNNKAIFNLLTRYLWCFVIKLSWLTISFSRGTIRAVLLNVMNQRICQMPCHPLFIMVVGVSGLWSEGRWMWSTPGVYLALVLGILSRCV
jgi:hypothetical protein